MHLYINDKYTSTRLKQCERQGKKLQGFSFYGLNCVVWSSRPVVLGLTLCAGGSWAAGSHPDGATCIFFVFFFFHRIFPFGLFR